MPGASKDPALASTALGPVLPSERVRSLERQRAELLRKINDRKRALERLERSVVEAEQLVARRLGPVHENFDQVNRELYRLFEELLDGVLSKRAHRLVRDVFRMLLDEGLISVPEDELDAPNPFDDQDDEEPWDDDFRRGDARGRARDEHEAPGASAAKKGPSGAQRDSLKPLFRRLALALHPDRVQDEAEKQERTRLLKQIVHAYERGDVATLLQAEKSWLEEHSVATMNEDAQCEALERLIAELHDQLAHLRRATRRLRDAEVLQLVEVPLGARRVSELEKMATRIEHDLQQTTRLRDFVHAFANHRMSLEDFLVGPELEFAGELFDFDDLRERASVRSEPRPRRRRGARRVHRR